MIMTSRRKAKGLGEKPARGNPGLRGKRPATKGLSHGTALGIDKCNIKVSFVGNNTYDEPVHNGLSRYTISFHCIRNHSQHSAINVQA